MPKYEVYLIKQVEVRGYTVVEAENKEQAYNCLDWISGSEIEWDEEDCLNTEVIAVEEIEEDEPA